MLFLVALFLTKSSVILLCRKLFSINMKKHRKLCDVMAVVCGLWCLGAILALNISCDSLQQIGYQTFCPNLVCVPPWRAPNLLVLTKSQTTRWNVVAIIEAITEVLIFSLSLAVVLPLHMRTSRKISVLLSFAPRLVYVFTGVSPACRSY